MRIRFLLVGLVAVLLVAVLIGARGGSESPSETPAEAVSPDRPEKDAVHIATTFLTAMTLETVLDDAARRRVIREFAAPQDADRLVQIYDAERTRVARSYRRGPRFARAALAGYRVDSITAREATVAIWAAAIGGSRTYKPVSDWSTSVVRLRRVDGQWAVRDVRHEAGPSPAWPIRSLAAEGSRFKEFRFAP